MGVAVMALFALDAHAHACDRLATPGCQPASALRDAALSAAAPHAMDGSVASRPSSPTRSDRSEARRALPAIEDSGDHEDGPHQRPTDAGLLGSCTFPLTPTPTRIERVDGGGRLPAFVLLHSVVLRC